MNCLRIVFFLLMRFFSLGFFVLIFFFFSSIYLNSFRCCCLGIGLSIFIGCSIGRVMAGFLVIVFVVGVVFEVVGEGVVLVVFFLIGVSFFFVFKKR